MKKIYAIYDNVAKQQTGPLFTQSADAAAIRLFSDGLADKTTTLGQHPQDYDLVYLGYLDEEDNNQGCRLNIVASLCDEVILRGSQWLAMHEKNTTG